MTQTRDFLRQAYGLDADIEKHVRQHTFDKTVYEFVCRQVSLYQNSITGHGDYDHRSREAWQHSYCSIKDPSWPDCPTPQDFGSLPSHIQQECREQHRLSADHWTSTDLEFKDFQSDASWDYEPFDLVRIKHIVVDQLRHIVGRRVIDFGTHTGLMGATCLYNQARHVTVTDIRPESVAWCQQMLALLDPSLQKFTAQISDINNITDTENLCQDRDTVILSGIMNIVTDHYGIMRAVTRHRPQAVIIHNWNPSVIADSAEPLIYWWLEDTQVHWKGFDPNNHQVRVGCPNPAWFDAIMQDFGYALTRRHRQAIWSPFKREVVNSEPDIPSEFLIFERA
jgi:hypothetical protein